MSGFEFEGYTCLYRSRDILDSRDEFLLKEGKVPGLVPVFLYKENLDWVFVYDLEGGYTLGEIYGRGEKLIGVNWFVSFLEEVDFCVSEFFFDLEGFFISTGFSFDFHLQCSAAVAIFCRQSICSGGLYLNCAKL